MNTDEIKKILPHRGKMLLIDETWQEDGAAKGKYTIRGTEWFLDGHFPGNPVVPGVILCEILAQSVCVLLGDVSNGKTPFFTGMSNVKFKHPVKPGDTLDTYCTITKSRHPFYFVSGCGSVRGNICVKAEFSFALIDAQSESAEE